MKKLVLAIATFAAASAACALAGCGLFTNAEKEPVYIDVVYHLNGGEPSVGLLDDDGVMVQTIDEADADDFKPVKASKATYVFDGWYSDPDFGTAFTALSGSDKPIHLYAKWTDKIIATSENFTDYFSVSSRWNGVLNVGRAAVDYSISPKREFLIDPVRSMEAIEISATPKLGSWRGREVNITLGPDNEYSYSNRTMVTEETQFQIGSSTLSYTVKTDSAELYLLHKDPMRVNLEANGGILQEYALAVHGGDTLARKSLPEPVRDGYKFEGWYSDAELTTSFENKIITRETTFYAKWTKLVVITFDTRGGSVKPQQVYSPYQSFDFGSEPTREGFGFMGWYRDKECTKPFTDRSSTESKTLYARWEPYRTITFDVHGGSPKEALKVLNTAVLDAKTLGADPQKEGLIFKGWYTDSEFKYKYNGEAVGDDMTLHAYWCYEYTVFNDAEDIGGLLSIFFDYGVTFERMVEPGNTSLAEIISVHLTFALKEQFRNFEFSGHFLIDGKFLDGDGKVLGHFIESPTINTSAGKPSLVKDLKFYQVDYQNVYAKLESIALEIDCYRTVIYLPEGYRVGDMP